MLIRITARLMIPLMFLQTAAFAQTTRRSTSAADAKAQEQPTPIVLPPEEPQGRVPKGLDAPVDPDIYVIGPYDQFVLFLRAQEREIKFTVMPEGTVLLPNVGTLKAAGLTITEFRVELKRTISKYYPDVEFTCELLIPRTFVVYVLGEVESPGAVQVRAPFRVDMAIVQAGGILSRGTKRTIQIRENAEVVQTVDLERFQRLGDMTQNVMLHEGQSIFVPPRTATCQLLGEVWRSGTYEVLPGERVVDVIALGGGSTPNADLDRIVVERLDENYELSVTVIDEAGALVTEVRDRDAIVVPDRRSFPGTDFVRIDGGGGRQGRIMLQEGETLGSFVPRFIRLERDHDLSHAVIERRSDDDLVEFIPVDLNGIIAGTAPDTLALMPGDVISIPQLSDVVYVTGEVARPGEVEFQHGLPAGRYIALAGGTSSAGAIDKLEIYTTAGERRDGDRDSLVYRGETIIVKRRWGVIFGTFFFGLTSLASLVLSIYAVSQATN